MKILILIYYFPPEVGSGPHLPFELGESLVKLGHEVTVVTGFPRYHVPSMPEQYRGRFLYKEQMGGMQVLRINMPNAYATSAIRRGLVQQLAPWVLALRALPIESPDLVFTLTPPLAMGLAASFIASRFRIPCVLNVQDLFPQSVVDLGLMRNRVIVRFFEWMERLAYRSATAITAICDGNRKYLIAKAGSPQKVLTIPNWVDTAEIRPGERMNEFRRAHALGDDFVVLFAGTMGWSQGLDVVVQAARELAAETGLVFLMVGDGVERTKLETLASGLSNVRFLPMQPKEVYPKVLAASDACLVTLRAETATPFPSKTNTIMAAGRPVLASLPPGDAPSVVSNAQCGLVRPAGDARGLASAILTLKKERQAGQQMGMNGRLYAEKHLSRFACVGQYEDLFRRLTDKRSKPKPPKR